VARWVLLLGFTLLFGSVSLIYPFGRDQATYAFMGDAILHGKTLYRDIPVGLLPMTALVHALAILLFGRTMAAIRILDLLWTLVTAGVLSLLVAKVLRRPWLGLITGLLYSFIYYNIDFWNTAQVDGFLNLPLVVSIYLLARGLTTGSSSPQLSARRGWASSGVWLSAGLLMGIALLFRYTLGLLLPGAALVLILAPGRRRAENWRAAAWFCGGCLLTGLVALFVIYLSGALPAFIGLQFGAILPYARLGYRLDDAYLPICLFGIPGLIAALALLAKRRELSPNLAIGGALILAWLGAVLASALVQGKFFIAYHYLSGLPPLAVIGAFVVLAMFRRLAKSLASARRRFGLVVIALAGLAIAAGYPARLIDLTRVASNRQSLRDYWSGQEFSSGKFSVSENLALAEYLAEGTGPHDRIANFGIDPPFVFPAWREPVLAFTTQPGVDPASWKLPAEFRANPPSALTVKHGERLHWVWVGKRDAYEHLMAFTELRDLVSARYELEARVGHFDVLRLVDSDSVLPVSADSLGFLREDLGEALDWLRAWTASAQDSCDDSVRSILWPCRVPDGVDSALGMQMISHKALNRMLWLQEKKLDDLLPALSVWIAEDDRPFARQDPFRLQSDGMDHDAGGVSFRVRHRCRNGLVFIYGVRRSSAVRLGCQAAAPVPVSAGLAVGPPAARAYCRGRPTK
jgi:hypothetical protein